MIFLPGLILMALLLSGFAFGKSEVELKSETPLIDLGAFVKESPIGRDGSAPSSASAEEAEGKEKAEEATAEETGEKETAEQETEQETTPKKVFTGITIEITHDIITVNGERCADEMEALEKVKEDWRVGLSVNLVDNYAQYSCYRKMYQVLRDCNISVVEKQQK